MASSWASWCSPSPSWTFSSSYSCGSSGSKLSSIGSAASSPSSASGSKGLSTFVSTYPLYKTPWDLLARRFTFLILPFTSVHFLRLESRGNSLTGVSHSSSVLRGSSGVAAPSPPISMAASSRATSSSSAAASSLASVSSRADPSSVVFFTAASSSRVFWVWDRVALLVIRDSTSLSSPSEKAVGWLQVARALRSSSDGSG